MENVAQYIEALIFASEQSVEIYDIKQVIREALEYELSSEDIEEAIHLIEQKYAAPTFAIQLQKINNGYQFLTKKNYHKVINQLQIHHSKKKLSQAALETLAIIAYRQPITKLEIEQIRGVSCDYSIQKLLDKGLIQINGKSDAIGKPLLYGTSKIFMDYFGINCTADLPKLKDIANEEQSIGDVID
ncbi:SMC-Scp complex subunit ScpB [Olivibacter sp. SDN3]|uniref:SMC-Scp complex subunit ScpB n=1 Tax=Olivibacter sp. SDN3 TaxID=2764720 RepID=UPI00165193FB|nr:SMC-Scp complex subunit ScpB [Olivibacter sp. SDN3]QNL48994.1 SMC-Scp complex subunit ScpB [Olivibacter sp. SDN3]